MGNACGVFFSAVTPRCVTSAQPGEHHGGGAAEAGLSPRAEMKPADPRGEALQKQEHAYLLCSSNTSPI